MSDTIDKVIAGLNQLSGLPAASLVLAACLAFGYALRFINAFPNNGIPVAVILFGALAMSLVADSRASSMAIRVWVVRNILVGMTIGLIAWIIHKSALSKLEDWISAKFDLGNTAFFKNKTGQSSDITPPEPPKP